MSICPALRRIDDDLVCEYADKSVSSDLYDLYCFGNYAACPIYERRVRTTCNIILDKGVGKELENAIINAKKRILVSSPWIGRWYAEKLAEKALEGVKVFVITSSDEKNRESVEILRRVMERRAEEGVVVRDIRRPGVGEEVAEEVVIEEAARKIVKPSTKKMAFAAVISMLSFAAAYYLSGYPSLFYVMAAFSAIAGFSAAYIVAKIALYYDEKFAQRKIEVVDGRTSKTSAELVADKEEEEFGLIINDLVHAKLYVVDDRAWLGSANLTRTGMNENYEVLVEIDAKIAEALFAKLWRLAGGK